MISIVKRNVIANYASAAWTVITSIAFVPIYIKYIGIEAYGLIGFFSSLQIVLSLLDLGLGTAFSREIARLSASEGTQRDMKDLIRTFSLAYWGIAIVVAVVFAGSAPFIAEHWFKSGGISKSVVRGATLLMGLGIAFRWPSNVYAGALSGLQKQVTCNILAIVYTTLRSVGAVAVLWLVSPTVIAFFLWQLIATILVSISYIVMTHLVFPKTNFKPRFKISLIKGLWKFAAGMATINICATILYQLDKILLSKLVSLEQFGYYTLASNLSYSLIGVIFPVTGAMYPRFTQIIAANNTSGLKKLYHYTCQVISILVVPLGVIIILFSREILLVWTHKPDIAAHAWLVLSFLTAGITLNAFMAVPYYLQAAYGWTKPLLIFNIGAVICFVPLIFFLVRSFGPVGGAAAWIITNVCYILVVINILHTKVLIGEKVRWYLEDVGKPVAIAVGLGILGRIAMPTSTSYIVTTIMVSSLYFVLLVSVVLSSEVFWAQWRLALVNWTKFRISRA
jgi:O-antigen/teichoic acid export membrane protein